jgi:chromosomal replication initiation ATPase DnaA
MYELNNQDLTIDQLVAKLKINKAKTIYFNADNLERKRIQLKKEIGELRRLRETLYTEVINYANSINIYVKKPEIASVDYDGLTYNEAVIRCACTVFGALETDLKSKSRKREAVWARYYIWARYKQNNPKTPLHKVGKLLGDISFHHATILYGIQAFERLELYDNEYQKKIEQTDLLINNFLTDAAK